MSLSMYFYITLCRSMEMLLPAHHCATTTTPPFLCTPAATNQCPRSPLSACDCSRGPGPLLLPLLLLPPPLLLPLSSLQVPPLPPPLPPLLLSSLQVPPP